MIPTVLTKIYSSILHYFAGMAKGDGRLVGLLGTLILHLIAAILFMLFKIGDLQQEFTETFMVDFETVEITEKKSETEIENIQLPVPSIEKIFQGDNEMLNIARNLANRSEQTIKPEEYIDMVKEEMIKSGQLGKDNYIDEQKRLTEKGDKNPVIETREPETKKEEDKPLESQEMAANYKGPTRIYYDLAGRNHIYLPIPIYMCEGSGKVVLSINVNQKGAVEEAKVIAGESTTKDNCLVETAISTALMSRFRPDVNSPKIQRGTITYHFVAQ